MNEKTGDWKFLAKKSIRDGFVIGVVLFFLSCLTIVYFYQRVIKVHESQLKTDLLHIAQSASVFIDSEVHNSLQSPDQETGGAYQSAVIQLRKIQKQIPNIKYIYTTRLVNGKVHFVLDAALSGDADKDGIEDHSSIMDIYEDPDASLILTLETGKAHISEKPYSDKWGTFITASTPIYGQNQNVIGALSVDMKADDFLRQKQIILWLAVSAVGIVFVISMTIGGIVCMLKKTSLQAECERIKGFEALIESQERVRASDAKLRSITNAIPGAVYQYEHKPNGEHRFAFVSKGIEEMMEVPREEVLENFNSVWNLVVPDDVQPLAASIQNSLMTYTPWTHTFRVKTKSGKVKWIRGSSMPDPDHPSGLFIWNGILLDVTETKSIEQQLLQSQKMETVGTLAGGMAHDLNNQLTPIVGYVDLLLQTTDPSSPDYDFLNIIRESAVRCVNTIKRLMNFARPSSQLKEWLFPHRILTDFKNMLEKLLPKTINVQIVSDENLWPIEGNETEVQSVLLNLAANARDAMPQGGRLIISAENICSEKPEVMFTVSDTGSGIAPENLNRIYEPFFTTKAKGVGTGLGMAMVFKIVKDHKAVIDVSSKVGSGTTFQIFFPANPSAVIKTRMKSTEGVPDNLISKGEMVLFADDEEPIRNLGKTLLEKLGYHVVTAADGEEAVRIYGEHAGDIKAIMLDMTMPKLTGRQCLQYLLKINPSAKILLASGFTIEGLPQELIADGASGFLSKPYDILTMGSELKNILKAA